MSSSLVKAGPLNLLNNDLDHNTKKLLLIKFLSFEMVTFSKPNLDKHKMKLCIYSV